MKRRSLLRCAAGLAPLALPFAARAQARYPTRPIKLVVAFEPGGSTDLTGRLVGRKLDEIMGQPFIIENRAGAGSNIGSEYVAHAPADGYTLLMGTISAAVNMSLYRDLRFDLMKDFAPITIVSKSPSILVVHPKLPIHSLQEFIAYAKAHPGKLNYASSGTGNTPHLAMEMLKQRTGIDLVHVPYKGAGPALRDEIAGTVDAGIVTALSAIPSIQAGQLRALAVSSAKRMAVMPDIPTFGELGVKNFEITSWNGLYAPAGTSPAIVQAINAAWVKAAQMPDLQKAFAEQASVALSSTPEELRAFTQQEIKTWGDIIESVHVEKI